GSARSRAPAAAPTPWPSPTTRIARCSPTSSTPSSRTAARASPAAKPFGSTISSMPCCAPRRKARPWQYHRTSSTRRHRPPTWPRRTLGWAKSRCGLWWTRKPVRTWPVNFCHVLHAAIGLLVIEGRLSYQRLRAEFDLDDTQLQALRFELTEVKGLAVDQDGEILAWAGVGDATLARAHRPTLAFRSAEPAPTEVATPQLLEAPAAVEPVASEAERRPLTVMFCDLADSTALSTKLDPEDLQDVIRAYRERCTDVIREYEGFVAKYMGDGILVYFGYPKSLERNAERAIRTGLAIVAAMAALNHALGREKGIDLAVRIGIATGLVVVGEIVGEGLAQERTVIGEAPNVAARLQGIAPRNGIVIGALTKEIAGDVFVYQELGARELKGISRLVKAWSVSGLSEMAEEGETEAGGTQALVGRDEEIGLLRRAWQSTKDQGRGQVVSIAGEPGIGKTALVETLRADARAEHLPRIVFSCSPYHTNSALYPVIEHVRRLLRWQPEDTAEGRLEKLEAML